MKNIYKISALAILAVSLTACGEGKEASSNGPQKQVTDLSFSSSSTAPAALAGKSTDFTVTVHNNGSVPAQDLIFTDTLGKAFKPSLSASSNTCTNKGELAPGASCVLPFTFTGQKTESGFDQSTLTINAKYSDNLGQSTKTQTFSVTGDSIGDNNDLAIAGTDGTTTKQDFTYTLSNNNPFPVTVKSASFAGRDDLSIAKTSACVVGTEIAAGKTCTLTVHYTQPSQADVNAKVYTTGHPNSTSYKSAVDLKVTYTPAMLASDTLTASNSNTSTDLPVASYTWSTPLYFQPPTSQGRVTDANYEDAAHKAGMQRLLVIPGQYSDQFTPQTLASTTTAGGTANVVFFKLQQNQAGTVYPAYDFTAPINTYVTGPNPGGSGTLGQISPLANLPADITSYTFNGTTLSKETLSKQLCPLDGKSPIPAGGCYVAFHLTSHTMIPAQPLAYRSTNKYTQYVTWTPYHSSSKQTPAPEKGVVSFNTGSGLLFLDTQADGKTAGDAGIYAVIPTQKTGYAGGYVLGKVLSFDGMTKSTPYFAIEQGQGSASGRGVLTSFLMNQADGISNTFVGNLKPTWNVIDNSSAGYTLDDLNLQRVPFNGTKSDLYNRSLISWAGHKGSNYLYGISVFRAPHTIADYAGGMAKAFTSSAQTKVAYTQFMLQPNGITSSNWQAVLPSVSSTTEVSMNAIGQTTAGSLANIKLNVQSGGTGTVSPLADMSGNNYRLALSRGGVVALDKNNLFSFYSASTETPSNTQVMGAQKAICQYDGSAIRGPYHAFATLDSRLYFAQVTGNGNTVQNLTKLTSVPFSADGANTASCTTTKDSKTLLLTFPAAAKQTTFSTPIFDMVACDAGRSCH